MMRLFSKRGQSMLEYGLMIAVVAAALMIAGVYVKHSICANFQTTADQINNE